MGTEQLPPVSKGSAAGVSVGWTVPFDQEFIIEVAICHFLHLHP